MFLGLLSKLADLQRPADIRLIILGIFDPFSTVSPLLDRIPLGVLDDCWEKRTFQKFDVLWTPSEVGHLWNSEAPFLAGLLCTCGSDCDNVSVLLLLTGMALGSWTGVLLGYFSILRVNQVSLRPMFSVETLCELRCTRYFQFGGIVTSIMNGTVEISSSNTTWNLGETLQVYGFITRAIGPAWNFDWSR